MKHLKIKKFFPLLFISLLNADESIDDLLIMDFGALQDIPVISATKTLTPLSKIPATVRVITAKQIQQRGYITLEEALGDLPGFQFRNTNGFNTYSFMRGAPSQNNLILLMLDGVKINEINSGGFYGGLQYNLENVKRIEVLYGPSSVLYGTNAISGIINIITYSPQDYEKEVSTLSLAAGSFNTKIGDFRTGYFDSEQDWGLTFSGRYATSEKADLGGTDGDYNWNDNMENYEDSYDVEGRLQYKDFQIGVVYQDKQSSRTTNYNTTTDGYKDSDTLWHITFLNLWARHSHSFSNTLSLNSLIYYHDTTVEDDTVGRITTTDQVRYYRPNSLLGVEEQLNYEFSPGNNISLGAVFEKEKTSNSFSFTYSGSPDILPEAPVEPNMLSEELFSIYLQSSHDLTDNINLTLGVRYDSSSIYEEVWTPRLALLHSAGALRLRALYSEAYRAPSPWDYTYGVGNNSLEEERMKSYEIGADYRFNTKLNSSLNAYYNIISGKLVKDSDPKWVNSGELETIGLEWSVDYTEVDYSLYFNYTYTASEDEYARSIAEISEHTANAGATYSFNKHIELTIAANYVGERKNPELIATTNSDIIDDYIVFSTQLSYYDFYKWDIHLQARNLMDETYYHSSNLSGVDRYRQPQQNLMLKAQYKFEL